MSQEFVWSSQLQDTFWFRAASSNPRTVAHGAATPTDKQARSHDVIAAVTMYMLHSYPKQPRLNTPPHKPHHHEHTTNRFQLFQRSQQTWGCHVLPRTSWQFGSRATTAHTFLQPFTAFTKQITSSLNVYHLFSHKPVLTNN